MVWKRVTQSHADFVRGQGGYYVGSKIHGLGDLLRDPKVKNFEIQLQGPGIIRTKNRFFSRSLSMDATIGEKEAPGFVSQMLTEMHGGRLFIETTFRMGDGEAIRYQLPIVRERSNGTGSLKLNPVLPKELLRGGHEGVEIKDDGKEVKTVEGISPGLNDATLAFARQLKLTFGLGYDKLDSKCVKKVCVSSRTVTPEEIAQMLENKDMTLRYYKELLYYPGHGKEEEQRAGVSVSYNKGSVKLQATVAFINDSESYRFVSDVGEDLVEGAPDMLKVDNTKPITYSRYYSSELGAKISQTVSSAAGAVGTAFVATIAAVFGPIAAARAAQEEAYNAERAKVQSKLKTIMDTYRPSKADSEGFCMVQYNPECLLENGNGKAQQDVVVEEA